MNTSVALRPSTVPWLAAARALALAAILTIAGRATVQAQPLQTDLVDTAVAAGSFTTLATALQAAGLVDTLKGSGPFTVFAPTDQAFAELPAGALEKLLADPEQLRSVLTYHVVPGAVGAAQVVSMSSALTVQGQPLQIGVMDGMVHINQASVTTADIMVSNGIIHVIDAVLLPPADAESMGQRTE
ncbi:MAG: fasciclin domain-containing protein [Chloroflexota bacterium]